MFFTIFGRFSDIISSNNPSTLSLFKRRKCGWQFFFRFPPGPEALLSFSALVFLCSQKEWILHTTPHVHWLCFLLSSPSTEVVILLHFPVLQFPREKRQAIKWTAVVRWFSRASRNPHSGKALGRQHTKTRTLVLLRVGSFKQAQTMKVEMKLRAIETSVDCYGGRIWLAVILELSPLSVSGCW